MDFAIDLRRSGATAEEALDVLLDSGADPVLAHEAVRELFPDHTTRARRRGRAARDSAARKEKAVTLQGRALSGIQDWLGYKDCVGHNKAGYLLIGLGFGLAYVICSLTGPVRNDRLLLIGGPLVTALDLAYRRFAAGGHWLRPDQGGRFLCLPIWVFGLIWLVLGACGSSGPEK